MRRFLERRAVRREDYDVEASNNRYDELYDQHHMRLSREYYAEGGTGDYKPDAGRIDALVKRQLDKEDEETKLGRALGDDRFY